MGRVAMLKRKGGMASSYQCQVCPCTASFISIEEQEPSQHPPLLPGQTCQHTAQGLYGGCWYPFYSDITSLARGEPVAGVSVNVSVSNVT